MLSKGIKHHRIYILKMPRDCNQTRSADRWGNSQLKNFNFLAPNTYFSSLYWCEFSLTKCRKYWKDRRIIQKYFENKTNIYPRFRSQWERLAVFLSNSSFISSTSHSILARERRNRSMNSQSAISTRKGRLWWDLGLRAEQNTPACGRHFV